MPKARIFFQLHDDLYFTEPKRHLLGCPVPYTSFSIRYRSTDIIKLHTVTGTNNKKHELIQLRTTNVCRSRRKRPWPFAVNGIKHPRVEKPNIKILGAHSLFAYLLSKVDRIVGAGSTASFNSCYSIGVCPYMVKTASGDSLRNYPGGVNAVLAVTLAGA